MKRTWADRIRPALRKVAPAARVLEATTAVLGQLKEPTVFGVMNAVGSGLRAAGEVLNKDNSRRYSHETVVPYELMVDGFRRLGADLVEECKDNRRMATVRLGGRLLEVNDRGDFFFPRDPREDGTLEWCRQVADSVLPAALYVSYADNIPMGREITLSPIRSAQAGQIWARTSALLGERRSILLTGRPGVGKTTIAQAIARDAGLGRTLIIDGALISEGDRRHSIDDGAVRLCSPGVIIVDDVDKVRVQLSVLEHLRRDSRLLILTANNGTHDRVLDGAMMRPARVDEVFEITPSCAARRAPFDRLSDAEWLEVEDWPHAYLNEVEKRVAAGVDLRLDDLRARLKLRIRSGEVLE